MDYRAGPVSFGTMIQLPPFPASHPDVRRLLGRRGRWLDAEAGSDLFAAQEPLLASTLAASLQGRIALGPRAGKLAVCAPRPMRSRPAAAPTSVGLPWAPRPASRWRSAIVPKPSPPDSRADVDPRTPRRWSWARPPQPCPPTITSA